MLISVKRRFVFVSNTKSASTSIETVLLPFCEIGRDGTPDRKHTWMADAVREYAFLFERPGFEPNTFFKFGVLRDPVDWIMSWYRYRKGNQVAAPLPASMTFEQFWEMGDWNKIIPDTVEKRLQSQFFLGKDGKQLVDFIIPYTAIAETFPILSRSLGIYKALAMENVSTIKKEALDLPGSLIADLRDFYAKDYELIGRLEQINQAGWQRLEATRQFAQVA